MKKVMFFFTAISLSIVLMSFTLTKNKYPEALPSEYIEILESNYLETVTNHTLVEALETNFSLLFDDITSVNAHHTEKSGYFYTVFGEKDGIEKIELLKVEKSDVEKQTYSYINFSKINLSAVAGYCRSGLESSPFPFVCIGPCAPNYNGCLGLICGARIGNFCLD